MTDYQWKSFLSLSVVTWLPTRIRCTVKTCKLSLSYFHHFSLFTSSTVFGPPFKTTFRFHMLKFYTSLQLRAGLNSGKNSVTGFHSNKGSTNILYCLTKREMTFKG